VECATLAHRVVSCGESAKHVLVASLFLFVVVLELLLADVELIQGSFVLRLNFQDAHKVIASILDFAQRVVGLSTSEEGLDAL